MSVTAPEHIHTKETEQSTTLPNGNIIFDPETGMSLIRMEDENTDSSVDGQVKAELIQDGSAIIQENVLALSNHQAFERSSTVESLVEAKTPSEVVELLKNDKSDSSVLVKTKWGWGWRNKAGSGTSIGVLGQDGSRTLGAHRKSVGIYPPNANDRLFMGGEELVKHVVENPGSLNEHYDKLMERGANFIVVDVSEEAAEEMQKNYRERNYKTMKSREAREHKSATPKSDTAAESAVSIVPDVDPVVAATPSTTESEPTDSMRNGRKLRSSYDIASERFAKPVEQTEPKEGPEDSDARKQGFTFIDNRKWNRAEMMSMSPDELNTYLLERKQPSEEHIEEWSYREFRKGAAVNVERSNGDIETDWTVKKVYFQTDSQGESVEVVDVEKKDKNGDMLIKTVTLDRLRSWQEDVSQEPKAFKLVENDQDIQHGGKSAAPEQKTESLETQSFENDPAVEAAEYHLMVLEETINELRKRKMDKHIKKYKDQYDEQLKKVKSLRHETDEPAITGSEQADGAEQPKVTKLGKSESVDEDVAETEPTKKKGFMDRMRDRADKLVVKINSPYYAALFAIGEKLSKGQKRIDESQEVYEARMAVRGGRITFMAGVIAVGAVAAGRLTGNDEIATAVAAGSGAETVAGDVEKVAASIDMLPAAETIEAGNGLNAWMTEAGITSEATQNELLANPDFMNELYGQKFIYYDPELPGDVKWGIAESGTTPQSALDTLKKYASK